MIANEGQRRLAALGISQAEIGRVCGVTKQAVSQWKQGTKVPGPKQRRAMETAYGIPVGAWDTRAGGAKPKPKGKPPASTDAARADDAEDPTEPVDRVAQLEDLRKQIEDARKGKDLTANELARLVREEGQIVERLARVEEQRSASAALLEKRIVTESPYWQKLKGALFTALKKHKAAAKDVLAAVTEFEKAS